MTSHLCLFLHFRRWGTLLVFKKPQETSDKFPTHFCETQTPLISPKMCFKKNNFAKICCWFASTMGLQLMERPTGFQPTCSNGKVAGRNCSPRTHWANALELALEVGEAPNGFSRLNINLCGGSKYFYFHPDPWGKWIQFDEHIFQMG